MACKSTESGKVSRRGQPSIEWYKDGKPQYYCYGYIDKMTDKLMPECKECRSHVYKAQEDLDEYNRRRRGGSMRLIDADALKAAITVDGYEHFSGCLSSSEVSLLEMVMDDIDEEPTIDAVHVVRCRECKNYVIVDEFEGGKRYMCLVNHFSYLDNDGDNQFCSYGERKEGAGE